MFFLPGKCRLWDIWPTFKGERSKEGIATCLGKSLMFPGGVRYGQHKTTWNEHINGTLPTSNKENNIHMCNISLSFCWDYSAWFRWILSDEELGFGTAIPCGAWGDCFFWDGQGLNQGQCIARGIKTEAHDEFCLDVWWTISRVFSNSCIVIVVTEQTLFFSLTVFR